MVDAQVGIKLLVNDALCNFGYCGKDSYGPIV